jgi:hypothetical protein
MLGKTGQRRRQTRDHRFGALDGGRTAQARMAGHVRRGSGGVVVVMGG